MSLNTRLRSFAWKLALAGSLLGGDALAALRVSAMPVLGPNTPFDSNWIECAVRIDNDDTKPIKGFVELTSSSPYGSEQTLTTLAPFAAAPTAVVTVRLPTRGFGSGSGPLQVRVLGEDKSELTTASVIVASSVSPMLLDLSEPPRLAGALRDVPVSLSFDPTGGSLARSTYTGKVPIATGSARIDAATGDPVLPDRAAGYSSATVVVMRSDQLAHMTGMALDALANYVLAGGSLAVVVARPEDLRGPSLTALVGAEINAVAAPRELSKIAGETLEQPGSPDESPSPSRRRLASPKAVLPADDVVKSLHGYAGGNLRPTVFGASASYGLGEVHLLAFDPLQAPGADDPWVRSRVVDLVHHAWDRREFVVTSHASHRPTAASLREVTKALDPNEGGRWGIVAAAVLLIGYSVVAGPLNFSRAAKKGRPLRALIHLPLYALGMFVLLVLIGAGAKGWTGQSRHLTLVEAMPGMPMGAATRFRGFFTSQSRTLNIRATDLRSVIDTAEEQRSRSKRSLLVDRDGVSLVGLATMPWETVVVREDGFANLGAGLSVVRVSTGELTLTNRTAHDLRAVLVVMPKASGTARSVRFFPRIKDGESKNASEGKTMAFTPWRTGGKRLATTDLNLIKKELEGESRGLTAAWGAVSEAAGPQVNWWPEDVPVVLAQIDGGEGVTSDAGLRVGQDRVLVRWVGYGGVP